MGSVTTRDAVEAKRKWMTCIWDIFSLRFNQNEIERFKTPFDTMRFVIYVPNSAKKSILLKTSYIKFVIRVLY